MMTYTYTQALAELKSGDHLQLPEFEPHIWFELVEGKLKLTRDGGSSFGGWTLDDAQLNSDQWQIVPETPKVERPRVTKTSSGYRQLSYGDTALPLYADAGDINELLDRAYSGLTARVKELEQELSLEKSRSTSRMVSGQRIAELEKELFDQQAYSKMRIAELERDLRALEVADAKVAGSGRDRRSAGSGL